MGKHYSSTARRVTVDGVLGNGRTVLVDRQTTFGVVDLNILGPRGRVIAQHELSPERARAIGSALLAAADAVVDARGAR